MTTISNSAPRGIEALGSSGTNQVPDIISKLKPDGIAISSLTGDGVGEASTNNVSPVYVARPKEMMVMDGDSQIGDSLTSAYLEIRHRDSSSDTFGSGPVIKNDGSTYIPYTGDFTMECFTKFDAEAWTNEVINAGIAGGRLRTSFFGYAAGTGNYRWMLQYYQNTGTLKFTCNATTNGVAGRDIPLSTDSAVVQVEDGKWHHYAVTFDENRQEFVGWMDYKPVLTNTVTGNLRYYRQGNYRHYVGNWLSGHPFPGWFDQVRVTRRVLPSSRFLRLKRPPSGLILLYR